MKVRCECHVAAVFFQSSRIGDYAERCRDNPLATTSQCIVVCRRQKVGRFCTCAFGLKKGECVIASRIKPVPKSPKRAFFFSARRQRVPQSALLYATMWMDSMGCMWFGLCYVLALYDADLGCWDFNDDGSKWVDYYHRDVDKAGYSGCFEQLQTYII